jgi:aryl-alcohol dehydrogenase-like predicted oxidoreductase
LRYRQVGHSDLSVSVVGLGGSNFGRYCDQEQARAVVDAALDEGVNFIDTAEAYPGSEDLLGPVLRGRRNRLILASKFGHPWNKPEALRRGSRQLIVQSLEGTLKRLETDHLDLYMMHFPDPETPIDETLSALEELIRGGKVRYAGCSNFAASEIMEAEAAAQKYPDTRFVCAEDRYNVLQRDVEETTVRVCLRYGMGVIAYSPLASGLLTGKYRRGEPHPVGTRLAIQKTAISDAIYNQIDDLCAFAAEHQIELLQLALGGLIAFPGVTSVIPGATTPAQVRANIVAAQWEPSTDVLADLAAFGETWKHND